MRRLRFTVILLVFMGLTVLSADRSPAGTKESFQSVADNLDIARNTRLHIKEYWKGMEGQGVVWSGVVQDVKGGRGRAEVLIHNKARGTVRGYNIIIVVHDISKAAKLKRGQSIKFRGVLHNYSQGKRGAVVITLREADIL